ncbi:hypothetical protein ACTHGP_06160 [[Pasteurella] aerogenes]
MTVRKWESFLEQLDHEIARCSIQLNTFGYRVDDKREAPPGIREHSQVKDSQGNKIKCCDYFYLYEDKFFCLEFSDLYAQYEREDSFYQIALKNTDSRTQKRWLSKIKPIKTIFNEVNKKFLDTDYLLKHLYHKDFTLISGLPESTLPKYFFVVWHLGELDSIDTARLFDKLQDDLRNELTRRMFMHLDGEKIFIVPLNLFENRYCHDVVN